MIWVKHVWFWLMERCQTHPSSRLKATKKVNQSGVLPKGKMQLRFFDNCFRKCCWDDDDVDVTETLHCTFDGFSNALYEQEWRRVIFEILAKLVYEHIQSLPGVRTKAVKYKSIFNFRSVKSRKISRTAVTTKVSHYTKPFKALKKADFLEKPTNWMVNWRARTVNPLRWIHWRTSSRDSVTAWKQLPKNALVSPQCLKIIEKVAINITSEASYVYILSGQKLIKNAKTGQFWRVFEKLKLAVKQCYQTGQF